MSKVMHECLQVELARNLFEKKELKNLKTYLSKMKKYDIRTFQRMGMYLKHETEDIYAKLYMLWCDTASDPKTISNE